MIKRYLGDYNNFICIAGDCPDTCCSGWAIEIDEDSLTNYQTYDGPDKSFLHQNIDWAEEVFCQKPNGDCAFLQEDGLCRMYRKMGEEHLCMTCDLYPRHIEEFPNVREYSLSVSCPVVAKDLIQHAAPLTICEDEDDTSEELYEDFNEPLYHTLCQCREKVLAILQDRDRPYYKRAQTVLQYMKHIQNKIDHDELLDLPFAIDEAIDASMATTDLNAASDILDSEALFPGHSVMDLYMLLYELEPLRSEFRTFMVEAEDILSTQSLPELELAFNKAHPLWSVYCEQLSVYFAYTYMCGAVYDDYVYSMACQSIYNACMIKLLWMAKWNYAPVPLTDTQLSEIVYSYSRELEHSNDNMILLEQLLDEL